MMFFGCFIIGASGLFRRRKSPTKHTDSFLNNFRLPSFIVSPHSSITTGVVSPCSSVRTVLRMCGFAQILPAVIQSIMVYMIGKLTFTTFQYLRCHAKILPPEFSVSSSIKTASILAPLSTPVEFGQPIKISNVHDGILPLCQGDQSVRLVERLVNHVAFHVFLRHRSSLKDLCYQPHYSI